MGDDARALFLPVGATHGRMALAVFQYHVFHRLIGDLPDLFVQCPRQQVVVAGIDHQYAVIGDDERQVVVVSGVLIAGRLGGAYRRPHTVGHLDRLAEQHRIEGQVWRLDRVTLIPPDEKPVGVILYVGVAHGAERRRGQRAALIDTAVDDDRCVRVRHQLLHPEFEPATRHVVGPRRVDHAAEQQDFTWCAHVDQHRIRAALERFLELVRGQVGDARADVLQQGVAITDSGHQR